MFSSATLMYFFVETPLHAGSGRGLGAVDLPIQRERATGYPLVQASGIKGKLRAEAKGKAPDEQIAAVFGPETASASDHAGAISPGDARLLLLPVRSLLGVFAWTTSANALARVVRDAKATGLTLDWKVNAPPKDAALVSPNNDVSSGDKMALEEFSYTPKTDALVETIGKWLAGNALPTGQEYEYWREKLPRCLVILPEDDFRDFAMNAMEVVTRVRLDNLKKTVESGALWTEESLPTDTLLYAPVFAAEPRKKVNGVKTADDVLNFVKKLNLERTQLGGDETVGRGLVALRIGEVQHV